MLQEFADVIVTGYPLGFHDKINNLPIFRKGMISSVHPNNFRDEPFFNR